MVEGNIKTIQIVKVEKNVLTKGKLEEVQNMKLRNKVRKKLKSQPNTKKEKATKSTKKNS